MSSLNCFYFLSVSTWQDTEVSCSHPSHVAWQRFQQRLDELQLVGKEMASREAIVSYLDLCGPSLFQK